MDMILERGICLLIGYALGCLQFAYILGKLVKKIDIRDYGSGNAGTTNVIRVMGKRWGFLTFFLDVLKGVAAVLIVASIYGYTDRYLLWWAGIGVILGHNYPFYMQFRGGKGIAATIGVVLAADPRIVAFCFIPTALVLYLSKYMSLASLTAMVLMVTFCVILHWGEPNGTEIMILSLVLAISGFIRHRANIQRLLEGRESKIGQKVKIAADLMNRKGKGQADDDIYRSAIRKNKKTDKEQVEKQE